MPNETNNTTPLPATVEKELERVYNFYKLLAKIIGVLFLVAAGLFWGSVSDMKSSLEKKGELLHQEMANDIREYKTSLEIKLKDELKAVEDGVNQRIEQEFRTDNINAMVEKKARERIDAVADDLITEAIRKRIAPQIASQEVELQQLEIKLYASMAINDNRSAYDSLYVWALNNKSRFKPEAMQAIELVKREYEGSKYPYLAHQLVVQSGETFPPLTFEEFKAGFLTASKEDKEKLIIEIWKRADIPNAQKMAFMAMIIKGDNSLKIVAIASKKIIEANKLNYRFLDLPSVIAWCDKNI